MKISRDEVLHVAKLAKLNLTEEATDKLANDMLQIMEFADKLNELNTEGVTPTAHAMPLENAFREDEIKMDIDRNELLKNAPSTEDGYFVVPKVVD